MARFQSYLNQHKRWWQGAALLLAVLVCFVLVWFTALRGMGQKSRSWMINDSFNSQLVLEPDTPLVQTFLCDQNLLRLGFIFQVKSLDGNPASGSLELSLLNAETGELLATSTGTMDFIPVTSESYYTVLGLSQPVNHTGSEPARYELRLTAHYNNDNRLSVAYTTALTQVGLGLSQGDKAVEGTLALMGVTEQIGGFVHLQYAAVVAVCLLAVALGWWFLFIRKTSLHRAVFVLIITLGLAFHLVLPPYAAPDEQFHINQSFTLASMLYDKEMNFDLTAFLPWSSHRPSDENAIIQDQYTTVFTWREVAHEMWTVNTDPFGETVQVEQPQVDNLYHLYWVSGLGVYLGFLLRLGFMPTLVLGRLFNLVAYGALVSYGIKRTPVAKNVFAVVALLPMSLHLAASFSRDALLLAFCFAFAGLAFSLAYQPDTKPTRWQLTALTLMGMVIAPSKLVYMPVILLALLIPAARLGRHSVWLKTGFVTLCLLSVLSGTGSRWILQDLFSVQTPSAVSSQQEESPEIAAETATSQGDASPAAQTDPSTPSTGAEPMVATTRQGADSNALSVSSNDSPISAADAPAEPPVEDFTPQTGEQVQSSSSGEPTPGQTATSGTEEAASVLPQQDDSICYTLPYILSHPVDTVRLVVNSFVEHTDHYVKSLFGGTLSYFIPGVSIAWVWVILLAGVLVLAWLSPQQTPLPPLAGWSSLLIGLACCGLVVLGCISWTPTYYTTIYGMQGRYFLPVLPLLFTLKPRGLALTRDCGANLLYITALLNVGVVCNAFLSICAR